MVGHGELSVWQSRRASGRGREASPNHEHVRCYKLGWRQGRRRQALRINAESHHPVHDERKEAKAERGEMRGARRQGPSRPVVRFARRCLAREGHSAPRAHTREARRRGAASWAQQSVNPRRSSCSRQADLTDARRLAQRLERSRQSRAACGRMQSCSTRPPGRQWTNCFRAARERRKLATWLPPPPRLSAKHSDARSLRVQKQQRRRCANKEEEREGWGVLVSVDCQAL